MILLVMGKSPVGKGLLRFSISAIEAKFYCQLRVFYLPAREAFKDLLCMQSGFCTFWWQSILHVLANNALYGTLRVGLLIFEKKRVFFVA